MMPLWDAPQQHCLHLGCTNKSLGKERGPLDLRGLNVFAGGLDPGPSSKQSKHDNTMRSTRRAQRTQSGRQPQTTPPRAATPHCDKRRHHAAAAATIITIATSTAATFSSPRHRHRREAEVARRVGPLQRLEGHREAQRRRQRRQQRPEALLELDERELARDALLLLVVVCIWLLLIVCLCCCMCVCV